MDRLLASGGATPTRRQRARAFAARNRIAVIGLAIALTATAIPAGARVGDVIRAGRTTGADGQTTLLGRTATGNQLAVSNRSSGGGGILGVTRSLRAPGVAALNEGSGPALIARSRRNVAAGFFGPGNLPPFIVGSTARVDRLNADALDGVDSADLARGPGGIKRIFSNLQPSTTATFGQIAEHAGLVLEARCLQTGNQRRNQLQLRNSSGQQGRLTVVRFADPVAIQRVAISPGGAAALQVGDADDEIVQMVATAASGPSLSATLDLNAQLAGGSTPGCYVAGTAVGV